VTLQSRWFFSWRGVTVAEWHVFQNGVGHSWRCFCLGILLFSPPLSSRSADGSREIIVSGPRGAVHSAGPYDTPSVSLSRDVLPGCLGQRWVLQICVPRAWWLSWSRSEKEPCCALCLFVALSEKPARAGHPGEAS
jgi:hypothetical protein